MELRRRIDAEPAPFGNLLIRNVTPSDLKAASMAEIEVPIGADNPPFAGVEKQKVYVGITGEIEFVIEGTTVRIGRGDVLYVAPGESYSYHNGGYEAGRLLLLQVPGGA